MSDLSGVLPGGDAPGKGAVAVVPHNTNKLTSASRALWVGSAGNLTVLMEGGQTVTFSGVPGGSWMPIRVQRVNSTGTTASNIVAVF